MIMSLDIYTQFTRINIVKKICLDRYTQATALQPKDPTTQSAVEYADTIFAK